MTRVSRQREPEWLALIVPVIVIGALGYVDMWRYVAFPLPAFWAWPVTTVQRPRFMALLVVVSVATRPRSGHGR